MFENVIKLAMNTFSKRDFSLFFLTIFTAITFGLAQEDNRQLLHLRKYTIADPEQEDLIDYYMEEALLPALKRQEIKQIGVFKSHDNSNDSLKTIFILHPLSSLNQLVSLDSALLKDELYNQVGAPFLDAPHDSPPYLRMESVVLKAFVEMPALMPPKPQGDRSIRVYELRNYESPTEAKYRSKVAMFNEGGEVALFEKLGFNAVFYGEVISGPRMPNLMYMTTFRDMATRDSLWKEFFDSGKWKSLEKDPQYQHNVNHADIYLLYPTPYSDY
jgi:hypothetical protein